MEQIGRDGVDIVIEELRGGYETSDKYVILSRFK